MTTILGVRRDGRVAVGGDGQVTIGRHVVKHRASKVRRLSEFPVLVGFAGAAADAMSLLERFEGFLKKSGGNTARAAVDLAREWRSDKVLRQLRSILLAADVSTLLLISGSGDVIEPDDGVAGIGSGGAYATAAARALIRRTELSPEETVRESLGIAAQICIYTNAEIRVETLP